MEKSFFIQQIAAVYGSDEAAAIYKLALEKSREFSVVNTQQTKQNFDWNIVITRLLQHEPIQYILERAWFYYKFFNVNPSVLIPRPETEELVHLILKTIDQDKISVLDVGTGSGCIAVSLAQHKPNWKLIAVDKSFDALESAKTNAAHVLVDWKQIDFLNAAERQLLPVFDVLVSNPPYIPIQQKECMSTTVKDFEPAEALFVPNEDPLIFYKAIQQFSSTHLLKGGHIFLETHFDNAKYVAELFKPLYPKTEIIKDMQGIERFVHVS